MQIITAFTLYTLGLGGPFVKYAYIHSRSFVIVHNGPDKSHTCPLQCAMADRVNTHKYLFTNQDFKTQRENALGHLQTMHVQRNPQ